MKTIGRGRGGPWGAGVLAAAFASLAAGVVVVCAMPVPASVVSSLRGMSPAAALACLLIAARLALPAGLLVRNLLSGAAGLAALTAHLPATLAWAAWVTSPSALGAPAPMITAGLVCAALALIAEPQHDRLTMRATLRRSVPLFGLTLIGLLCTSSRLLDGPMAGTWLPAMSVSLAPAAAFLALAGWALYWRGTTWLPALRNDDRIALSTFFVMVLLVTITAFGTFWAVQTRLQESEQERLVQSAYRREMAFNHQLDTASRLALDLAQRPSIARALLTWPQQPSIAEANLREEMDAVWSERLTAIRFESTDSAARLPARGTWLASTMPEVSIEVSLEQIDGMSFQIQWNGGLLARTRVPVLHQGATVGWVHLQQRLELLTEQLFETADLGPGVEVKLCYPDSASQAMCMPTGRDLPSTRLPLRQPDGQAAAIALGMRGGQGAMLTADMNGISVIDVYASVRRPLALRLRQSVDAVMAPVRDKLGQVLLLVVTLLAAGVTVLSLQVRPLASRLVSSEREAREAQARAGANEEHLRAVMNNVADGIMTTDPQGRVTYLNHAAEAMTGWPAAAAIGQPAASICALAQAHGDTPALDLVTDALNGGNGRGKAEVDLVRRGDGQRIAVTDRVSLVHGPDGVVAGTVLVFHDVTAQREQTAAISHEASHDALTGLANRKAFERRLAALTSEAPASPPQLHSLVYIDLDKFKQVNDSAGHEAGDHLLQQVTALMHKGLRATDLFARVGGDEFAVLLPSCASDDAARIAEDLRAAVAAFEFIWRGAAFRVGTSIGVTTFEGGCGDMAAVVRSADAACYRAKHGGRNRVEAHLPVLRRVATA